MSALLEQYRSSIEFAVANVFFALSTWIAMWTGMLSFAAVTFGAVGGFTSARMDLRYDLPFGVSILIGAAVAGIVALALSGVLLRLESHWMALATVALILITRVVVLNVPAFTGGSAGMPVPGKATWPWLIGLLFVACWAMSRLRHSRFGMAAHAAREDPSVAAAMGVNIRSIRRTAFVWSGVFGGIGGVLMANLLRYISPDTFFVGLAFTMIAAVVLGGTYHWLGPIFGAIVFTLLPEVLRSYLTDGNEIANGLILLVIIIFLPRGLIDPRRSLHRLIRRRRAVKEEAMTT